MSWLAFWVTLSFVSANFLDFIIGRKLDERIGNWVTSSYVNYSDNFEWKTLYKVPALFISKSVMRYGNQRLGIIKVFAAITIYSIVLTLSMSIITAFDSSDDLFISLNYFNSLIKSHLIVNLFADLMLWPLIFFIIHRMISASLIVCFILIVFGALMMLNFIIIATVFSDALRIYHTFSINDTYLFSGIIDVFYRGIINSHGGSLLLKLSYENFFSFIYNDVNKSINQSFFHAMIPILFYIFVFLIMMVSFFATSQIKYIFLSVLERISDSPKGIFTIIAAFFSAILTVINAWIKI